MLLICSTNAALRSPISGVGRIDGSGPMPIRCRIHCSMITGRIGRNLRDCLGQHFDPRTMQALQMLQKGSMKSVVGFHAAGASPVEYGEAELS